MHFLKDALSVSDFFFVSLLYPPPIFTITPALREFDNKEHIMKRSTYLLALLSFVTFTGCSDSDNDSPVIVAGEVFSMPLEFSQHKLALTKATGCDAYRSHLLDAAARNIVDARFSSVYFYKGGMYYADADVDYAVPSLVEDASAGSADTNSAGDFTATNNQEVGVDEVDDIKNDGTWMYNALNDDIMISKIWPVEDAKLVAKIPSDDIENAYVYKDGMLLDGNHLIVIDTIRRYSGERYYWYYYTDTSTRVRVYDVSDPTKPTLVKKHEMEGSFVQGRMINHRVHLVLSAQSRKMLSNLSDLYYADIPGLPKYRESDWYDGIYSDAQREENIKKYLPIVRGWLEKQYPDSSFITWPQYTDGTNQRNLLKCEDIYIPGTSSSDYGMMIMAEISGDQFENVNAQAITDDGWTVYASSENMYVVSSSSNWYWDCYENSSCKTYSHIHRFNLGKDNGQVRYMNSGEVEGIVNNQYWMSEYDGHLRVASDENLGWSDDKNGSRLSILKLDGPEMKIVGSVDNIGNGESLFAARMFGNKGYMVTYKQTDPLFTFDLSDPAHPVKKGELKINGYSSYIHPMDENHLLTIGQDGDENGNTTGLQLQIFDVTDLANPVRSHHRTYEHTNGSYTWSYAQDDPHAFTYHAASGLLSIPITVDTWNNYTTNYWGGAYIYHVTPDKGFEFLGKVTHEDLGNGNPWQGYVSRSSFYFAEKNNFSEKAYVYTNSPAGMKINDANHPDSEIKAISFLK